MDAESVHSSSSSKAHSRCPLQEQFFNSQNLEKMYLDMFIPNRSVMDFDYAHYMLTEAGKGKGNPAVMETVLSNCSSTAVHQPKPKTRLALGNTVYLLDASNGVTSELVTFGEELGPLTSVKNSTTNRQWLYGLKDHTAVVKALAWCSFQANLLASGGGGGDRCTRFLNTHTGACLNTFHTGSHACSLLCNKNEREMLSSHDFT
ncbi:hypothetical protein ACET3Z_021041 [Daucus carota]